MLKQKIGENKVFFFNNDFAREESISACLNNSPIIFIDFVQDSYNQYSKLCTFEIYIIHAEPSVNAENREKSFCLQLDFLESIDTLLQEQKFEHTGAIKLTHLKKEYGEMTKNGFLTIYKRTFEVPIYINPYEGQ